MGKSKASKHGPMGAFVVVDDRGFICEVLVAARDDQQAAVIQGALARITRPDAWAWLRRMIGKS
jgi:hypothetical protein